MKQIIWPSDFGECIFRLPIIFKYIFISVVLIKVSAAVHCADVGQMGAIYL